MCLHMSWSLPGQFGARILISTKNHLCMRPFPQSEPSFLICVDLRAVVLSFVPFVFVLPDHGFNKACNSKQHPLLRSCCQIPALIGLPQIGISYRRIEYNTLPKASLLRLLGTLCLALTFPQLRFYYRISRTLYCTSKEPW